MTISIISPAIAIKVPSKNPNFSTSVVSHAVSYDLKISAPV